MMIVIGTIHKWKFNVLIKIFESGLPQYSFYVYMMLFTNVKVDRNHIKYKVKRR